MLPIMMIPEIKSTITLSQKQPVQKYLPYNFMQFKKKIKTIKS